VANVVDWLINRSRRRLAGNSIAEVSQQLHTETWTRSLSRVTTPLSPRPNKSSAYRRWMLVQFRSRENTVLEEIKVRIKLRVYQTAHYSHVMPFRSSARSVNAAKGWDCRREVASTLIDAFDHAKRRGMSHVKHKDRSIVFYLPRKLKVPSGINNDAK